MIGYSRTWHGDEARAGEARAGLTLAKARQSAAANGLSDGCGARLREILDQPWNVFLCGLCGDPSARVESLTVTFKPET